MQFACLHIEEVDGCTSMVVSDCFVVIICDAVVDSGDRFVEIVVTGDITFVVVVVNSVVVFVTVVVVVVVAVVAFGTVVGAVVGVAVVVGVAEVSVVVVDSVLNVDEGIEVVVAKLRSPSQLSVRTTLRLSKNIINMINLMLNSLSEMQMTLLRNDFKNHISPYLVVFLFSYLNLYACSN